MPRIVHHAKTLYLKQEDGTYAGITPASAFELMAARELGSPTPNEIRLTSDSFDRKLKSLFKLILDAELAEVIVGVNASGDIFDEKIRTPRWLAGRTESLYRFLTYGDRQSFDNHPAQQAINYLWLSGGVYGQLRTQVRAIGDIRVAYANVKGRDKYVDAVIEGCSALPDYQNMKHQATLYLRGETDRSPWLAALLGNEQPSPDRHPLMGGIMLHFHSPIDGLLAGWMAAFRLLVAQWLASEYHPDLLNEHMFVDTPTDVFAHSNYKKWLSDDSSNRK